MVHTKPSTSHLPMVGVMHRGCLLFDTLLAFTTSMSCSGHVKRDESDGTLGPTEGPGAHWPSSERKGSQEAEVLDIQG